MRLKKDTRKAIIDAAVEIFAQKGYEKATVDEIAAKADIAKGTVFYSFKTKEDIFFAIIEEGTKAFTEFVERHAAKGTNAKDRLEKAYAAAFEFFERYNSFCNVLISELWRIRTRWGVEPTPLISAYRHRLEKIFSDGQKDGEFRTDLNANNMGVLIFLLASISSLSKEFYPDRNTSAEMANELRLVFLRGLKAE